MDDRIVKLPWQVGINYLPFEPVLDKEAQFFIYCQGKNISDQ